MENKKHLNTTTTAAAANNSSSNNKNKNCLDPTASLKHIERTVPLLRVFFGVPDRIAAPPSSSAARGLDVLRWFERSGDRDRSGDRAIQTLRNETMQ